MHDLLLGCRLAACARWIDELAAPCGVRGLISPAVTIASTLYSLISIAATALAGLPTIVMLTLS